MSEKEWEKLFELIGKAVNLPGMSAGEKGKEIRQQAEKVGELTNLEEFCCVCEEVYDE